MKAIGYIRVSTTRQADNGVSLDAQKAKIRAYCQLKGMALVDIICDAGISGTKINRKGYQKIIALCKAKKVDAVAVYSLSRFTRSTKELMDFVETYIIKKSVELHSLSENLDTSTPMGRAMLKIIGVINELECEQAGQRTREALQYKKKKGQKTGGYVPFGYQLASDGKTLIKNPQEQAIIREVKKLNQKGYSNNIIAQILNEKGYPTKLKKIWTHAQVGRIIKAA